MDVIVMSCVVIRLCVHMTVKRNNYLPLGTFKAVNK